VVVSVVCICVSCAFFRGEVEHPGRRLLATKIDDPVFVAINTEGVYVIDSDDFVSFILINITENRPVAHAGPDM